MDDVACYCTNVRRAALALTAIYDEALARHGIKVTQFSLLRAVRRRAPVNLTVLAEATGLDRSTLGRNLRRMERDGLVRLSPGDDQRDRVVTLSARGRRCVESASRTWERVQAGVEGALGDDAAALVTGARRVARLEPAGIGHGPAGREALS